MFLISRQEPVCEYPSASGILASVRCAPADSQRLAGADRVDAMTIQLPVHQGEKNVFRRLLITTCVTWSIFMFGQILPMSATSQPQERFWQLIKEENGMQIFARDVPGSEYKEFKGTITVDASLQSALALLTNPSKCSHLYSSCMYAEVINRVSDNEIYVYTVYDAPWPFKNRDAISRCVIVHDENDKQFTLRYIGKPNYLAKKEKFVRLPKLRTTWKIEEKQKHKIHVVYEVFNEPGGNVTPSLSYRGKKSSIVETLSNLRRLLTEPHGSIAFPSDTQVVSD